MSGRRERRAARLLVIDPVGCVLLFRFHPTGAPPFWATVGGALDPGESFEEAARRELLEETGIVADPGPEIALREADFTTLEGEPVHAVERFYAVRVDTRTLDFAAHTDLERRFMLHHHWWSQAELGASEEVIFPVDLADMIDGVLGRMPPEQAIAVGRV